MEFEQDQFKKLINDAQNSFKEAISALPTKEASYLNSFQQDVNAIAVNDNFTAEEKRKKIKVLSDKLSSDYGININ